MGGWEEPNLCAGQGSRAGICGPDCLGDDGRHDRVIAIGSSESLDIDVLEPEDHGRVLDMAVVTHKGREAGHRGYVGVTRGINGHPGQDPDLTLLSVSLDTGNAVSIEDRIRDCAVIDDLNARLGEQAI